MVPPEEKRNMHKGTDKSSSMAGVYIRQLTLCGIMLERERERKLNFETRGEGVGKSMNIYKFIVEEIPVDLIYK